MNCTKRETERLPGALCPLECALLNLYDGLWVTSFRYSVQLKKYCFHLSSLIYFFWITEVLNLWNFSVTIYDVMQEMHTRYLWWRIHLLFSVFRFPDATLSQLPDHIFTTDCEVGWPMGHWPVAFTTPPPTGPCIFNIGHLKVVLSQFLLPCLTSGADS